MHFLSTIVTAALATAVLAAPATCTVCLTDAKATSIVNQFATLLTAPQGPNFNSTAASLLASDFSDTSDSIDLLAGIPLGSVTFPSKGAFIAGQGSQPAIPTITTLDVFHTCSKIAWRWVATGIGSGQDEVKGINVFVVNTDFQIVSSFSEFNSGAWLVDIGNPECSAS